MKKLKVQATYIYEIEVDDESSYVKDYNTEQGMIEDLVYYQFTTLPVIGNGVQIKNVEVDTYQNIDM